MLKKLPESVLKYGICKFLTSNENKTLAELLKIPDLFYINKTFDLKETDGHDPSKILAIYQVTNLDEIKKFRNLNFIFINFENGGDFESGKFGNFKKLQSLYIGEFSEKSTYPILLNGSDFQKLTDLTISSSLISKYFIGEFPELKKLSIKPKVSDLTFENCKFPKLESLTINYNIQQNTTPFPFKFFPDIKELKVYTTFESPIFEDGMGICDNLESLISYEFTFGSKIPVFPKLKYLCLFQSTNMAIIDPVIFPALETLKLCDCIFAKNTKETKEKLIFSKLKKIILISCDFVDSRIFSENHIYTELEEIEMTDVSLPKKIHLQNFPKLKRITKK